jgi:hypothetical protein
VLQRVFRQSLFAKNEERRKKKQLQEFSSARFNLDSLPHPLNLASKSAIHSVAARTTSLLSRTTFSLPHLFPVNFPHFLPSPSLNYSTTRTMPRGKGKRGGGGGGRGGKRGGGAGRTDSQRNDRAGGYNVVNQTNETMEAYYKAQKIIGDDEWTEFLEALKVPLPTTFRLTASRS